MQTGVSDPSFFDEFQGVDLYDFSSDHYCLAFGFEVFRRSAGDAGGPLNPERRITMTLNASARMILIPCPGDPRLLQ